MSQVIETSICEHPGCFRQAEAMWVLPWDEKPTEYLCTKHAHENGYCWWCCCFHAGIESFDWSDTGLCYECQQEINAEFYDEWDDDYYDY